MSRHRNFVFTKFNYTDVTIQAFKDAVEHTMNGDTKPIAVFLIMQEEICPDTGRPHLQGYMELNKNYTFSAIKKKLSKLVVPIPGQPIHFHGMHLEARKGSQDEAIAYCEKDETKMADGRRWTFGVRKRWAGNDAVSLIVNGGSMMEVVDAYPREYVRSFRGLIALKMMKAEKRHHKMEVIIYFGATGTGKSYKAYKDFPEAYTVPFNKKGTWWWPNYDGQETVILDDYRDQVQFTAMLKLMDRYPFQVQTKGGYYEFNSKRLVFTTNVDPLDWFAEERDLDKRPFLRRLVDFATIYDFGEMGETEEGEPLPVFTERTEEIIIN